MYPLDTLIVMKKDSGMRIRIDRALRDKFIEICQRQDKSAAQIIREFMSEYVKTHENIDKPILSEKITKD